jgi:DNA-binding IclR family transcriptional regulator
VRRGAAVRPLAPRRGLLGIAGPAVRLCSERLPRLAALVRESAAAASGALGGEAPI